MFEEPCSRFCGSLLELVRIDAQRIVAGCHGRPRITFIPGYTAGYQVLDDLG